MREKIREKVIAAKGRMALRKYELMQKKESGSADSIVVVAVFIIIVLVLALIFKDKVTAFVDDVFSKLDTQSNKLFS